MWTTSIPKNWFNLAAPSRFFNIPLSRQKNRNTLMFLEETQKYIYKIRRPVETRDTIRIPSSSIKRPTLRKFASTSNLNTVKSAMMQKQVLSASNLLSMNVQKISKQENIRRKTSNGRFHL